MIQKSSKEVPSNVHSPLLGTESKYEIHFKYIPTLLVIIRGSVFENSVAIDDVEGKVEDTWFIIRPIVPVDTTTL